MSTGRVKKEVPEGGFGVGVKFDIYGMILLLRRRQEKFTVFTAQRNTVFTIGKFKIFSINFDLSIFFNSNHEKGKKSGADEKVKCK